MNQNTDNDSVTECQCCYKPVSRENAIQCPNGHLICKSCIETSVKIGIESSAANDKCPCGCNYHISTGILEKILSSELMKKFDEIEAYNALTNTNIPFLRKCWKCGYQIIDEDESCPMNCPECKEKTCKKCGKKNHPSRTCEEADIEPMRFVEDMMSKSIVRECPSCHLHYFKEEGCNHMTCTRCKTEFCHLCLAVITGHVSEHFQKCKQSMDNIKYNQEQVQKARDEGLKKYEINV